MNTLHFSAQFEAILQKQALEAGVSLSKQQVSLLTFHAAEMVSANRKFNLTAITDPSEILGRHIIDSLIPCRYIPEDASVADIGSGAGYPGIPIKILRPDLFVTLVDRSRKKVNFLKYVCRQAGLTGIEAVQIRLEKNNKPPGLPGAFDVVISRAFADLNEFIAYAKPLLKLSGMILAMKGPDVGSEIQKMTKDTAIFRDRLQTYPYRLPESNIERVIVAIRPVL